jgi:hypothetical protein
MVSMSRGASFQTRTFLLPGSFRSLRQANEITHRTASTTLASFSTR